MKKGTNLLVMTAASIIFFAGSATAATTRDLTAQTMETKINGVVQGVFSDQTVFTEMQSRMMVTINDSVKKNTAARKRASVVKTCMECRAMHPIKVVISGRTTVLDADTQGIINRAMAKKVEATIREISSDPAVASRIQEKMMKERMPTNPLREKMQPFMMSSIMNNPAEINVAGKNDTDAEKKLSKVTCPAVDGIQPNC